MDFKGFPDFKSEEFDSPDEQDSGKRMKRSFLLQLQSARHIAKTIAMEMGLEDTPFVILSGYRTEQHNSDVGGSTNSSHLRGHAADIACDGMERMVIVKALVLAGFERMGVNNGSVHVDDDPELPSPTMWDYY